MGEAIGFREDRFIQELRDLRRAVSKLERMPTGLGSIASQWLTDGAVGIDQIDWSAMPSVSIAHWSHYGNEWDANAGWRCGTGGPAVFSASNSIMDIPSDLPPRTGFVREYSFRVQVYYVEPVGVTANSVLIETDSSLDLAFFAVPVGVSRQFYYNSGWSQRADVDAYPAGDRYLVGAANWAGNVGSVSVRYVEVKGRYVRA